MHKDPTHCIIRSIQHLTFLNTTDYVHTPKSRWRFAIETPTTKKRHTAKAMSKQLICTILCCLPKYNGLVFLRPIKQGWLVPTDQITASRFAEAMARNILAADLWIQLNLPDLVKSSGLRSKPSSTACSRFPTDIFEIGSLHAARDQNPRQPHVVFAHPTPAQTRTLVLGPKSQVQQCMVLVSYIKELVIFPIVKQVTRLTILQSTYPMNRWEASAGRLYSPRCKSNISSNLYDASNAV